MRAVLACAAIGCLLLGAGRVETRDARVLRGEIAFDEGSVVVTPGNSGSVRVKTDDLRTMTLGDFEPQPLAATDTGAVGGAWANSDIGKVHVAGAIEFGQSGVVTISASGWGLWGGSDSLHWAYRPLDGDGQVIARVRAGDSSNGAAAVGVMIRQDLKPDANMAATCLYPAGKTRMHRRVAGEIPSMGADVESKGETWIRLTRRGNLFTAYDSPDGRVWRRVDSHVVPMSAKVLAGIGAWTTNNTGRARAVADSVVVVPGTAGTSSSTEAEIGSGVILQDGSVRAGALFSADDESLILMNGARKTLVARKDAARMILGESSTALDGLAGRTGVLLRKGDFMEGEVTAIAVSSPATDSRPNRSKIIVTSTVFGPMELDAQDVAVVLFRDVVPSTARYKVRTADGSLFYGRAMELKKAGVSLDGTVVAEVVAIEDRQQQGTH